MFELIEYLVINVKYRCYFGFEVPHSDDYEELYILGYKAT
jgi:hypothetical protein